MSFENAIEKTLSWEGGYVNDPDDPGGETNFGLTRAWLDSANYPGLDLKTLTRERAISIYREDWWNVYAEAIDRTGLRRTAEKFFDAVVNVGPSQAMKFLQRALYANGFQVPDDGVGGPVTRTAALKVVEGMGDEDALIAAFRSEWAGFYRLLAAKKPSQQKFLKGWLRRAYS